MKEYFKRTKFIWFIFLSLFLCWYIVCDSFAQNPDLKHVYECINPERAILCAVIAVGIGLAGFAIRQRKRLR